MGSLQLNEFLVPAWYFLVACWTSKKLAQAFRDVAGGVPVWQPSCTSSSPVPAMTLAYLRVDAISPPLSEKYTGPYEVLCMSRNTAVLRIGDSEEKVNLERLKPFHGQHPVLPPPPRRGHLPQKTQSAGGRV